jgi:type IV pilus assembly protein PilO
MVMPEFLDPLVNAPRYQKVVLGVMGLVVLVAAAYFVVISSALNGVRAMETRRASVQKELADARRNLAELERYRREIAELERTIQVIKDKLPTEKEMPGLFRTVSEAAFQTGLAVALFQPTSPRIADYYTEVPIVLGAEGGYHQVGEFMERVAGIPRVVNVIEWKLSGLTKGSRLVKADLTLATYMYRPVGSPPPPKPGARPAPPPAQRPR